MEFSFHDNYRAQVELVSNGKNTVIYDDFGNPNIMVRLPRFDKSLVGVGSGTHGAFILDDKREVKEIWIGKFMSSLGNGGVGVSLPGANPMSVASFNDARARSRKKGHGWHLLNNIEYGAIALWSWKNGTLPTNLRGNRTSPDAATLTHYDEILPFEHPTGQGPYKWTHDNTRFGIYDLNGNKWDFIDGSYVTGKLSRLYAYGNGTILQNRFHDEAYFNLGMGPDTITIEGLPQGRMLLDADDGTCDISYYKDASMPEGLTWHCCKTCNVEPHGLSATQLNMAKELAILLPDNSIDNIGQLEYSRSPDENIKFFQHRGGNASDPVSSMYFTRFVNSPDAHSWEASRQLGFHVAYVEY